MTKPQQIIFLKGCRKEYQDKLASAKDDKELTILLRGCVNDVNKKLRKLIKP